MKLLLFFPIACNSQPEAIASNLPANKYTSKEIVVTCLKDNIQTSSTSTTGSICDSNPKRWSNLT